MPRFLEDKHREEVLAEFLDREFYPRYATEFDRVSSERAQRAGHDLLVEFEWLSEPVVVDEKAQSSDEWLDDPAPTFVVEIFGESWVTGGEPDWNVGWFVDDENESDYYTLVWLPDVSLFDLSSGVGDHPYLTYRPAERAPTELHGVADALREEGRVRIDAEGEEIRFERRPRMVDRFEAHAEAIPAVVQSEDAFDYGEWYYEPQHIYEAKIAVVEKAEIEAALATAGLTDDVLLEMGREAITGETVPVNSPKANKVMRSSGDGAGSADDEFPVVLVVPYETYHEAAEGRTFHYVDGNWTEAVDLF